MISIANNFNYFKKTQSALGKVEFRSCITKENLKIIIKEVSSKATIYNITINVIEGYVYWFTPIGIWDYDADPHFDGFLFRFYNSDDETKLLYEYELYIKPRRFVYELDISNDHFYYVNYINFFRECYYDRFELNNVETVFDVGANIGFFSKYIRSRGSKTIFAFEPDVRCREIYSKLNPNVSVYDIAISDTNRESEFIIDYNTELSRLDRNSNLNNNIVKCYTLQSALDLVHHEKIDLLKLDVEGEEEFIILNTSSEIINKFDILLIEYHKSTSFNFANFIYKIMQTHPCIEIDSKSRSIYAKKHFNML